MPKQLTKYSISALTQFTTYWRREKIKYITKIQCHEHNNKGENRILSEHTGQATHSLEGGSKLFPGRTSRLGSKDYVGVTQVNGEKQNHPTNCLILLVHFIKAITPSF